MALLLSACSSMVQTYPGEPRDLSQIAILRAVLNEFDREIYRSSFVQYWNPEFGKPAEKKTLSNFSGFPTEMHVLPGKYHLVVRCATGTKFGLPEVEFEAKAGEAYEFKCVPPIYGSTLVTVRVERATKARL